MTRCSARSWSLPRARSESDEAGAHAVPLQLRARPGAAGRLPAPAHRAGAAGGARRRLLVRARARLTRTSARAPEPAKRPDELVRTLEGPEQLPAVHLDDVGHAGKGVPQ